MAAPTQDDINKLQGQITDLNKRLDEMSSNLKKIENSSKTLSKNIGDSKNLLQDSVGAVKQIAQDFKEFASDSQAQYKYAEILAKTSKETAVNIGMSVGRSKEFTKVFNSATAEVEKFGGSATDVQSIMEEFTEESGRARIISKEEVTNMFQLTQGLNLTNQSSATLLERMDLMGVSVKNSSSFLNKLTADSQKLGLNASKVAKTLANNFDRMDKYSFKNGVKGMVEMAKLAVQMRMDVGEMLTMSEKFYEPEAAIEAVANLQMLGGDVAKAFGDPFEVMYLARNKPEELAKRVSQMTENMIQFNEKTGEYEFPPEARMQLKSVGTQLGINVDSIIDMAKQSSKIKDIKMNVSGNIQDEDMREGLASMAKMKDGKWIVDFEGKEIGIDEIGVGLAEKILAAPKNEEEAILEMSINSKTTNEILDNILKSMKTGLVAKVNVYELTEDILRPGMTELIKGVQKQVDVSVESLQKTEFGKFRENMLEQAGQMGINAGTKMTEIFSKNLVEELNKIEWKTVFDFDATLNPKLGADTEKVVVGQENDDFILRSSGEITSFTNEDDIIGAKKNGPLDKLMDRGLPTSSKIDFGNIDISGRIEIVSPDGNNKNLDMSIITSKIESMIISKVTKMFNNGGMPDGANLPQGSKGYIQTM
jgi:hypothetical protein